MSAAWKHVAPTTLLTEVTFGNENGAWALEVGHLTPHLLEEALVCFEKERGYLPKVIVTHMNPPWEVPIKGELRRLARKLNIESLPRRHEDYAVNEQTAGSRRRGV